MEEEGEGLLLLHLYSVPNSCNFDERSNCHLISIQCFLTDKPDICYSSLSSSLLLHGQNLGKYFFTVYTVELL